MCLYESECFARLREAVVDRVRFDCRNMRNKVTHAVFLVDHPYATRLVGFSKTFVYGEFGVLFSEPLCDWAQSRGRFSRRVHKNRSLVS